MLGGGGGGGVGGVCAGEPSAKTGAYTTGCSGGVSQGGVEAGHRQINGWVEAKSICERIGPPAAA